MNYSMYYDNGIPKTYRDSELPPDLRNIKLDQFVPDCSPNDARANNFGFASSGQSMNKSPFSGLPLAGDFCQPVSSEIGQRQCSLAASGELFFSNTEAIHQGSISARPSRSGRSSQAYEAHERSAVSPSQNKSTGRITWRNCRVSSFDPQDDAEHLYFTGPDNFQVRSGEMERGNPIENHDIPGPSASDQDNHLDPSFLTHDIDYPLENYDLDRFLTGDNTSFNYYSEESDPSYLNLDTQTSVKTEAWKQAQGINEIDSTPTVFYDPLYSASATDQGGCSSMDTGFQQISDGGLLSSDYSWVASQQRDEFSLYQNNPSSMSLVPFAAGNQDPGPSGYEDSASSSHAEERTDYGLWNYREAAEPASDSGKSSARTSPQRGLHSHGEEYLAYNTASCSGESLQSAGIENCRTGARRKTTQKRNRMKTKDFNQLSQEQKLERKKMLNKKCSKRYSEKEKAQRKRNEEELLTQNELHQLLLAREQHITSKIEALTESLQKLGHPNNSSRRK